MRKSREDYLRVIFSLLTKDGVQPIKIARALSLSKPSVTRMLKNLSQEGLVRQEAYKNVFLTRKGFLEARRMSEKYALICSFLKKLGYRNEKKIFEEAHNLEHAFSEETVKRLKRLMK